MTEIRSHISTAVPVAHLADTPADIIGRLIGSDLDSAAAVYVVDAGNRLLGHVPLTTLLRHGSDTRPVGDIMVPAGPTIEPHFDRETVASHAIREDLSSVAVTDGAGRFVGAIPPREIMAVLRDEHLEDLHRVSGILQFTDTAARAIEEPPVVRMRHRLPWLLIGLAGSMVATKAVAGFEATLQANVAIAFFIPMIVYLADAVGTQTESVAIRGLSFSNARIGRMLIGEVGTGALIGAALALFATLFEIVLFGTEGLALVLGLSVFSACSIATIIGLLLPWAFARLGWDPALSSGPVATVIQDLLSLLVYLTCAVMFLP